MHKFKFKKQKISAFSSENTIRELRLSLVLINAFIAGNEERTLSVFEAYEKLLGIFTPDGLTYNDVVYLPAECYAASADKNFACLALTLIVKQGTN